MTTTINICISADSHITEPAGTYIDRIDPEVPRPRAAHALRRDARRRDAHRQRQEPRARSGSSPRPAGPTEEVRLDTGKRFEDL